MLILGSWVVTVLALLFCGVALLMILLILVQKPKGGGLAGAFGGGGGGGQGAFGSKVGDVLTWATVVFFVAFLLLAMGLTWTIRPEHERQQELAPPAQTPARAPAQTPVSPATDVTEGMGQTATTTPDAGEPAAEAAEDVARTAESVAQDAAQATDPVERSVEPASETDMPAADQTSGDVPAQ